MQFEIIPVEKKKETIKLSSSRSYQNIGIAGGWGMGYLDILVYRCKLTILKFYQKFQFIFFLTVFGHKIHVKNL